MQKAKLLFFGVAMIVAAAGCVGGSKGLSSEDKDKLKPYILDSEPADIQHKVDVNFENKIHLLGYKAEPDSAKPGADLKLTFYWRCDDPLDDGWALFTHVHDDASDKSDNMDWNGPLRENRDGKQLMNPSRWEKGKIYIDEQTYKIPDWVKGTELSFLVGVWKGNARLRIVSGPNDGDNRSPIAKLKTGLTPPPVEQPHTEIVEVTAVKLAKNDKITIDGKPDDKAWGGAPTLGPFVDVGTGKPNTQFPAVATAKVLFDDANMYVLVEVMTEKVVGGFDDKKKDDKDWTSSGQPKLWTKETVELMIDPDGDGDAKDYYELQINPQNKLFHSQFDTEKAPTTEPNGPFGHEDWDPKLKSAVAVRGTVDKDDDKDGGYTVEVAIPWKAFTKGAKTLPPKAGEAWRMNLYAMKENGGIAWSPILGQGTFHHASRFGRIRWGVVDMGDAGPPAASASVIIGIPPNASINPATGAPMGSVPFPFGGGRPRAAGSAQP